MSKIYLFIAFTGFMNSSYTQTEGLNAEVSIQNLKSDLKKVNKELVFLKADVSRLSTSSANNAIEIYQLNSSIKGLVDTVDSVNRNLDDKINLTGKESKNQIDELGGDVEKNRLYWIIATLATILLGVLMYLFLGKRIKSSQTDVETQIRNTKKSLEEEGLKLDGELVKVFQKQLEVLESSPKNVTQEEDHSLVLKIADRLTAMETNHYRMDPNTKGLKQLKNAVKSIKENYLAKGYEIVEMLELEYKEGMNVTANFIPSENIEKGKRVITRVIKPQVNFNGKMIQAAQIEVSVGE
jgi:hypothetical protein